MDQQLHHSVLIIGSGPAGLTAAIYLSRAEMKPVVFEGPEPGGQLTTTTDVGNYPGYAEDISGPQLMAQMKQQALRFGTIFIPEAVTSVDFTNRPFTVTTAQQSLTADSVIVATGASAKWLGLESEQKLRGKGVSACATCDGFFFKNKDVIVVGGGDTAMEEATFLTKFVKSVTLVIRSDEKDIRASTIMHERAKRDPKISFEYNSETVEILGEQAVEGARIKNRTTGKEVVLKADGIFIAIGHKPNTDFLGDQLELEKGYIKVTDNTRTSVAGVFAGGDVHDYRYQQAITAAGMGCMAALDAEKYLHSTDNH